MVLTGYIIHSRSAETNLENTMAFAYQPVKEESFRSLEKLKEAARKEENAIVRIPVGGILKHGVQFSDDEYFGVGDTVLHFNQNGIRSFCSFLGIRLDTLELLEQRDLACEVLNDLLAQRIVRDRLRTKQLVVDERSNEIVGMLSESYVGYSNFQLLTDTEKLLFPKAKHVTLFPDDGDFVFKGGYSVNTQLSLRFTIKEKAGVIKGRGGQGDDVTDLGFQLKNSMVGDSSVNINFFLYRKICANGLVSPAGSTVNRIFHSGKQQGFSIRLGKAFSEIRRRIGQAGTMVKQLAALEFSPELLAKAGASDMIFGIIRGSKREIIARFKIPNSPRDGNRKENRTAREAAIIAHIPGIYAGELSRKVFESSWRDNASMFDFINVFTEYAKDLGPKDKIEIEEKAGALADWIARNKRKFG